MRIVVIGVALALIMSMLGCHNKYSPTMPAVGDSAEIKVVAALPMYEGKATPLLSGRYVDNHRLLVRCVKASGKRRVLEVYRLQKRKCWKFLYSVQIDYAATDLTKKVVIRDIDGRVVPRGRSVEGVPMIFSNFQLYPGETPPRKRRLVYELGSGWKAYIWEIGDPNRPHRRRLALFNYGYTPPLSYHEYQDWDPPNHWLWRKLLRTDGTPEDPAFEAWRE